MKPKRSPRKRTAARPFPCRTVKNHRSRPWNGEDRQFSWLGPNGRAFRRNILPW